MMAELVVPSGAPRIRAGQRKHRMDQGVGRMDRKVLVAVHDHIRLAEEDSLLVEGNRERELGVLADKRHIGRGEEDHREEDNALVVEVGSILPEELQVADVRIPEEDSPLEAEVGVYCMTCLDALSEYGTPE